MTLREGAHIEPYQLRDAEVIARHRADGLIEADRAFLDRLADNALNTSADGVLAAASRRAAHTINGTPALFELGRAVDKTRNEPVRGNEEMERRIIQLTAQLMFADMLSGDGYVDPRLRDHLAAY
jgi:hypothetical protein